MVQPYPSAGQMPEPVRPGPPPSVVMAVRLMYVGAVVSALSLIVGLATVGSLRASLHKSQPSLTPTQLHNLQTIVVVGSVVHRADQHRAVGLDGADEQGGQVLGAHRRHRAVRA